MIYDSSVYCPWFILDSLPGGQTGATSTTLQDDSIHSAAGLASLDADSSIQKVHGPGQFVEFKIID